jgi:hypothetical protein
MKKLKVICAATVLALSLSIPAYADDPKPSDIHDPGRATCVCETSEDGSTDLTAVDNDFSISAVVNMLWIIF